jgi:hypothetical protein
MEIRPDTQTPMFGVLLLIACLIVLFCLIGFVVSRILLLEVDSEISKRAVAERFR